MILPAAVRHASCSLEQIVAQVIQLKAGYLVDEIAAAFPGVQLVHHIGVVCDIYICFVAAIKNAPAVAADLACGRYLYDQQRTAVYTSYLWLQVQGRIDFLPVIDGRHEIPCHVVHSLRYNT